MIPWLLVLPSPLPRRETPEGSVWNRWVERWEWSGETGEVNCVVDDVW